MNDKYELTGESKVNEWGVTVHRVRALVDFPALGVEAGDLGGWIDTKTTRFGNARVSGDAWVSGDAQVFGNARVFGDAWVSGDARVFGNAQVFGNARVSGDAWVFGDAWVSGDAQVFGNARVEQSWHFLLVGPIGSEGVTATLVRNSTSGHILNVGCWTGTLDTLTAEVERRRVSWHGTSAEQAVWTAQYAALIALGEATVSRWAQR